MRQYELVDSLKQRVEAFRTANPDNRVLVAIYNDMMTQFVPDIHPKVIKDFTEFYTEKSLKDSSHKNTLCIFYEDPTQATEDDISVAIGIFNPNITLTLDISPERLTKLVEYCLSIRKLIMSDDLTEDILFEEMCAFAQKLYDQHITLDELQYVDVDFAAMVYNLIVAQCAHDDNFMKGELLLFDPEKKCIAELILEWVEVQTLFRNLTSSTHAEIAENKTDVPQLIKQASDTVKRICDTLREKNVTPEDMLKIYHPLCAQMLANNYQVSSAI